MPIIPPLNLAHVHRAFTGCKMSGLGSGEFQANVGDFNSDINWVIMDYLVSEGYPGAAEKFAQETNLCQPTDIEGICERVRIRNAIHSGQIDEAVGLINEIDPEVSLSNLPVLQLK